MWFPVTITAGRPPVVVPLCLKKTALSAGRVPVKRDEDSTGMDAGWMLVDGINRAGLASTPSTGTSKVNGPASPATVVAGPGTTVDVPGPVLQKTRNSFPFTTGTPGATGRAKIETAAGGKLGY